MALLDARLRHKASFHDASGFGSVTSEEERLPLALGMQLPLRDEHDRPRQAIRLPCPIRDVRRGRDCAASIM